VLLVLALAGIVHAADMRLEGQVICCEDCWNKADRTKVTFGTTEDLAKSAGCVANGDPSLLAVTENGRTVMYQLEAGRFRSPGLNWLDYIGDKLAVTGTTRQQKGRWFIRVNEVQVLQRSLAAEEGRKVLGTAPLLKLADLAGVEQSLVSRRGRIVVLNFWGTFCLPCVKEMPDLSAVQSNYAALGVEVIGAAADTASEREKVLAFVKKYKINFPIWLGATSDDMRRFGLGEALPATVILDREGRIVWQKRGATTKDELTREIEALTKAAAVVAPAHSEGNTQVASAKPRATEVSRVPS
jgi:thiol-disulfide isomerase/thioredoxin